MSENSVKDILAKFNQGNGPPLGPPLAQKPSVQSKPSKVTKPNTLPVNNQSSNAVKSSTNGVKSPVGRVGFPPGGGLNIEDITKVKLKKPPLPKPPPEARPVENQIPNFKLQPKPKPKPLAQPRQEPSPPFGTAHLQQKSQERSIPVKNESSLHAISKPAALTKKPKPPAPTRKDSLTNIHAVPWKPSLPSPSPEEEDKENNWKNGIGADEPTPPISDSENSSASSISENPTRRTSFLHSVSKNLKQGNRKPILEPLPPLSVIGNAPRKPAKPPNFSLAKYLPAPTDSPPPPARPPKPGSTPTSPPSLPARPGGGLSKTRPPPPQPVQEEQIPEDAGDIYDDVEGAPATNVPRNRRPFSLIETMDSDEEENIPADADDIYDDAESGTAPPALPPHPTPTLTVTGAGSDSAPPLPSISSIPALHGSGGSSVSYSPRSAEHSGSGVDEGEIYDDVEADGEQDELYEALDVDDQRREEAELAQQREEQRKQEEKRRKEDERLRKEQEKQQKKEEEKKKKKEKEEKKKKEKEEKDLRKRFNIKGDISIIDEGIVLEAMDAEYEKYGLQCQIGEKIEILRKEGNPPGKWLARNPGGHYGYVDHQFVRLEGLDSGEVYDDVMAEEGKPEKQCVEPIETMESEDEGEEENIYDAVN